MAMSKKEFIALADMIRTFNRGAVHSAEAYFTDVQLALLADFCKSSNPAFKRDRWLDYIAGNCGPNGGTIKK